MRKRHAAHHEEEHENHEAWVIPYADMLTLLMGLFVVLWAISSADMAKLEALQTSFAGSLGMATTGEVNIHEVAGVIVVHVPRDQDERQLMSVVAVGECFAFETLDADLDP